MSIADFFFGRKQNSTNKLNRKSVRTRNLRLEALEERALLSAAPLSADEYLGLSAQYAEFNLPEDMAELNVITLDLAEGDGLTELKNAIEEAGGTDVPDLIVVRTSDTANTIQYTAAEDELIINIDSTTKGSVTIVGLGTKPLTLDAAQQCRVMSVEGNNTIANLGGLTITNGMLLGSGSAGIYNDSGTLTVTNCTILENGYRGGISNNSGMLTVTNCTILGNNGCGIYNSDGTLKVINSAISENNGGGIDCYGQDSTITVTNCTFSENEDGGIFIDSHSQNSKLTITNCTILDNGFCGIFSSGQNSTLTVTDSTILGNESGIHNSNGTLTVTDSTISENEGGIYSYNGTLTITNCTISKNEGSGIEGSGALTVNDCTISKNKGRGIDCSGQDSTISVIDCTISGNTASNNGGGIFNGGTLTVANSTISENTASYGGGIFNVGTLTVTNCTISGNTATSDGGGIYSGGTLTVANSTISENTASDGGGIFNGGTLTVANSTISDNTALMGGGICIFVGTLTITNSTISGNIVSGAEISYGGGILIGNGTLTITNSTISGNTAEQGGDGIRVFFSNSTLSVTINNSIVLDTIENDSSSATISGSNNLSTYTDWSSGSNNFEYDSSLPLFVDAEIGDYHLSADSQAIDKGSNAYAYEAGLDETSTDLGGAPRYNNSFIDIGAYEFQSDDTYSTVVTTLNDSFDLYDDEWSLREAIYYASDYPAITFADGLEGQINLTQGELAIDNALIIDGDGRITINAGKNSRVFYVSPTAGTEEQPVVLNGLTIANGSDSYGGGIANYGILTVTDSKISGNEVELSGGGIGNYGTIKITNSVLTNNSAANSGGGIHNDTGTAAITNCTIWGNVSSGELAGSNGGGISSYLSNVIVNNSIVVGNTGKDSGNDIFIVDNSTVSGSNNLSSYTAWSSGSDNIEYDSSIPLFNNADEGDYRILPKSQAVNKGSNTYANNAGLTDASTDIYGASRFVGVIDIGAAEYQNDVTFSTEVTTLNDSFDFYDDEWSLREAIYYSSLISESDYPTITFADGLEGQIDLELGQLEITNALTIDGNGLITIDGGNETRIFNVSAGTEETPVVLNGLTIQNGYADYAGGGIFNTGALSITNSTITNNAAYHDGGGIDNHNLTASLTIENSVISNNTAMYGGGIHNFYGALTITGGEVSDNTATEFGGGIHNYGELTITGATISGNSAKSGGGINNNINDAYVDVVPVLNLIECTVSENTASVNGGGIYSNKGTSVIESSTISGNIGAYGGGFFSLENVLTVTDSIISGNTASTDGGGIRSIRCTGTITSSEISDNKAVSGAGIHNYIDTTLTVTDSTFSGNKATENGGGIFNQGVFSIINSAISSNSADLEGGGINNNNDSGVLTIANSVIDGNSAGASGGGLHNYYGAVTVTNSTFASNSASGNAGGGAIRNDYGSVTITNSYISKNSAPAGGGIRSNRGTLTVTNSTISENTATSYGGGIGLTYSDAVIINSAFLNNDGPTGGAITNHYDSALNLTNCTIAGNTSTNVGGIYNTATVTSNNTIIVANTANGTVKDIVLGKDDGATNAGTAKGSNNLSSFNSWKSGSNNLVYDSTKQLFVDAANGDYRLSTGSQAINKGSNALAVNASGQAIAHDLDNLARIIYNTVDIGAYEYRDLVAPTLSAVMTGTDSVKVTVGEVTNASGYTLEYSTSEDFANAESLDVLAGDTSVTGLSVNTTYYFRAMALGEGDYTGSEFCESTSATTDRIQVNAPTLSAATTGSYSIMVTVGEVENASGYTLEYSTSSDFADAASQNVSAGETTIAGLNANRTYYFRVMALGEGDYRDSEFSASASATTDRITLTTPTLTSTVKKTTATFSWDEDPNAIGYQFEYKAVGAEDWTVEEVAGTSISFDGDQDVTYTARVMALGVDDYTDSAYSEEQVVYINGAQVTINGKKVTVDWIDDSPAADSIRYRVAGTTKWTVKKLKAGVTTFTFNGKVGTDYEIEVLLDQQEVKTYNTTAVVLDQPKLKADKTFLKDDTFQVSVTNYAAKNLADNAIQAIVTVNGVQTTFDIENQEGSAELTNGGSVAFNNGLFTFTEMNSNTSYKVQVAFSDSLNVSTASSNLTVKTTKAPYLAPAIVSATAVSDTSIVVEWETAKGKGSDTEAQKYTVQYSLDGVKWTNATTGATGNSYTIQKLKGGNVYQVRVLATKESAFLASDPSEILTAETLALPKHTLDKTTLTDDSFTVNVSNYQTSNLPKATVVNIKSDKFGEMAINLENASGSATFGDTDVTVAFENGELTFTNVPSNTQQKIQVNFSDGVCTTAWSSALTVKTAMAKYNKPVLSSPTVLSSTSVLVEWTPVTGKSSPIEAQKYTVQYSLDGNKWTNATTSATGTSFTITKLKPSTKYLVAVIANKDANFLASDPSDSQEVTTL